MRSALWLLVLLCPNVSACAPLEPPVVPELELDLDGLFERAHFAFREAPGGALEVGDERGTIRVEADGTWALVAPTGAALGLETTGILAGEGARLDGLAAGELGEALLDRGRAVEVLRYGREGLEQSWAFAARPDAAIEVRVQATGLAHVSADENGHHFSDGETSVRYGHATWIDAGGLVEPVPVAWEDGSLVLRVPPDVAARSTYPAVLDPLVSVESSLGVVVASGWVSPGNAADVAFGNGTFVVTWNDARTIASSVVDHDDIPRALPGAGSDVFAARVSSGGSLLDPTGIRLGAGRFPAAAYGAGAFTIVWTGTVANAPAVVGARLTPAGAVTSTPTLGASAAGASRPDVAFATSSGVFLVAYTTASEIRLRSWNPSTNAVAAGLVVAETATGHATTIAWDVDSARALVSWRGEVTSAIRAVRADGAGAVVGAAFAITAAGGYSVPSVTAGNGRFAVGYFTHVGGPSHLQVSVIDAPTGGLVAFGNLTLTPHPVSLEGRPALAHRGTSDELFVAWIDDRTGAPGVYGTSVAMPSLVPASPDGMAVDTTAGVAGAPSIAAGDLSTSFLLSWERRGIVGQRIIGSSTLTGGVVALSTAANAQTDLAVAHGAARSLVVLQDSRGSGDVLGYLLLADGTPATTTALSIAVGAAVQASPDVATTGTDFLVAWEEAGNVWARTVSESGAMGPAFVALDQSSPVVEPHVAGITSGHYAVVGLETNHEFFWNPENSNWGLGYTLLQRVVQPGGALTPVVAIDNDYCAELDVTGTTSRFVVAARRCWPSSPVDLQQQIFVYSFDQSGLGPLTTTLTPILPLPVLAGVAIDRTKSGAVVVWNGWDPTGSWGALYSRRLDTSGLPVAATLLVAQDGAATAHEYTRPTLSCGDSMCLALFERARFDLRGVGLSATTGAALGGQFLVSAFPGAPAAFSGVAATDASGFTVLYQRYSDTASQRTQRVFRRRVSLP